MDTIGLGRVVTFSPQARKKKNENLFAIFSSNQTIVIAEIVILKTL